MKGYTMFKQIAAELYARISPGNRFRSNCFGNKSSCNKSLRVSLLPSPPVTIWHEMTIWKQLLAALLTGIEIIKACLLPLWPHQNNNWAKIISDASSSKIRNQRESFHDKGRAGRCVEELVRHIVAGTEVWFASTVWRAKDNCHAILILKLQTRVC